MFLSATSYIVLRLTGEAVIDRHTASYFNPFIDVTRGAWDLRYAPGIEIDQLPKIRWGSEVAGALLPEAASQIGLPAGIPVLVGTVDAMAEAVGAGVFEIGDMMVMYGTTAFLILVVDRSVPTTRVWNVAGVFPGQNVLTAGMSTSGAITEWFRRQFAGDLGDDAFATLSQEAATSAAGARGLLLLPYFSGERTPISDPGARGAIVGLNLSHTRGDLYRAIIDGCALGVRDNVEALTADWDGEIRRLVAVGGGAASDVWLGAVSSATRRPQEIPRVTIGAAYGDALLAALSQGLCTVSDAKTGWAQPERTVTPDLPDAEVYDHLFGQYRALYAATRPIIGALGNAARSNVIAVGSRRRPPRRRRP
jgi:xylulokinase